MINFENRLASLKNRRQGTAERDRIEKGLFALAGDQRSQEAHERLQESSAIKYVIGSMAPVSTESTNVSIEEGERVATTLIDMLTTSGINTEMRMQGSVALDIHIEGHSDVDMLILKSDILTVQNPPLPGNSYSDANDTRPMVEILRELRHQSENKLKSRYHAAEVDISGSKSIALSGGSLKRKVDIVPSSWHDTYEFQRMRLEKYKSVNIYDKEQHSMVENKPFLHISKINERDSIYSGNLKKVVRLMKNIVADLPDYKKNVVKKLTSYDIASIAYTMNENLDCSQYFPLVLLDNLKTYLLVIAYLDDRRSSLLVPDETRKIFNTDEKIEAVKVLHNEVEQLAIAVQKDISPSQKEYDGALLKNKPIIFT